MLNKYLFLSLLLICLVLPSANAIDLRSGTVLNSSISNSSITFTTVNVSVSQATVENLYVLLFNTSYTRGELGINISTTINWSTPNTNIDSGGFPYLSSSSSTQKVITSTLGQSVDSDVIFNVASCDNIGNIEDTAGSTQQKFQRGSYTCSDGVVTLSALTIESGSDTVLEISYSCSTFTLVGFKLIMLFASLIIILFVVLFVWRNGIDEITVGQMVMLGVGLIFAVTMWLASGQNLGAECLVS